MGKSIELSTKHPQFKKIAVDNKKIPGKKWGISCEYTGKLSTFCVWINVDKKVDNYSGYHNMVLRVSIMKNYVYNSIHCRIPSKYTVFCDICVKINSQKWIVLLIIPRLSTSYPQNVDNVT